MTENKVSNPAQKLVKSVQLVGLQLESFKLHSALTVQFSPTMTAIVGPNYSGKTAIEKAIFFALVGTSAVAGSKADLTKHGAKSCKVILTLSWGDDIVVVTRTPTTAAVTINGTLMASSLTAVTEYVAKMFGTDAKTLVALSRSSRGETSALLSWGAANLNRLIEDVYDVSAVDRLIEKAGAISSKAEAARAQLPSDIEDVEAVLTQAEGKRFDLEAAKGNAVEYRTLLAQEKAKEQQARGQLAQANASNIAYREAAKEKARFDGMFGECLETLNKLEAEDLLLENVPISAKTEAEAELNRLRQFKGDWNAKKIKTDLATSEIASLNKWLTEVYAPAKVKYDAELPLYEEAYSLFIGKGKEREELHKDIAVSLSSLHKVRESLKSFVCQACKRPFDAAHLEEAQKEEAILLSGRDSLEAVRQAMDAEIAALGSKVRLLENGLPGDVLDALSGKQHQLSRYESDLAAIGVLPDYGDTDSKIIALGAEIELISKKIMLKAAMNSKLQEYRLRKQNLSERLNAIKAVAAEIDTAPLETALSEAVSASNEFQQKAFQQEMLHSQYTRELGELDSKAKLLLEQAAKVKTLEYRASRFREVQAWLRKNKSTFLASYWDSLMAISSDFVSQATSGNVTKLIRDDSGEFMFEQDGKLQSVEGCASGAQQCIFGVSIRMALAELLPLGFGFIVLDEPSAELNDEHAAALAGALKASNRQVVLITHREGDQHSADSVISLG